MSPPGWRYHTAQQSDTGLLRTRNEDAIATACALRAPRWTLAVLADGMGGRRAGDVASALAVQQITHALTQGTRLGSVQRALRHSLHQAHAAIRQHAQRHADCQGMGATVVAAVFLQDRLVLAHLGDARAYLWRQGQLHRLTRDHSWVQEEIDAGRLSPEAAARSGQGHLVTRALGVGRHVCPALGEVRLEAGDLVMLCSDGLSDRLGDGEIAALLNPPIPLSARANHLIAAANARGGQDNISVVLVAVETWTAIPSM